MPSRTSATRSRFQKEPLLQGYITYLGQLAHGDFGISTSNFPSPVSEVIGRTLPYSIFLVGVAFFFAFAIGTFLGMLAAWRRGGSSTPSSRRC